VITDQIIKIHPNITSKILVFPAKKIPINKKIMPIRRLEEDVSIMMNERMKWLESV